jgi:hypothetical protein
MKRTRTFIFSLGFVFLFVALKHLLLGNSCLENLKQNSSQKSVQKGGFKRDWIAILGSVKVDLKTSSNPLPIVLPGDNSV